MKLLGYVDLDSPSAINIYASSFENKDVIEDAIAAYNEGRDDLEQITYTDYVGLMMSSVTPIITGYQRSKMPILRCCNKDTNPFYLSEPSIQNGSDFIFIRLSFQ